MTHGAHREILSGQGQHQHEPRQIRVETLVSDLGGVIVGMIVVDEVDSGNEGRQQGASAFEPSVDVARGEQAEVADLDEALGQQVFEKAPNEFGRCDGGGFFTAGTEDDGVFIGADESGIADGDAMGVAPEIAVNLLGSTEGAFGVDDPTLFVQLRAAAAGGASISVVAELALTDKIFEGGEKLAAKQSAQNAHGKKEVWWCRNPATLILGESTTGDDAVDVRMELQVAGPGVQHGSDAELRAVTQPFRIGGQGRQDGAGGLEQQVEERGAVLAAKIAQFAWQREDEVKVVYRQNAFEPGLDPAGLVERLAPWAMSIPTRVVRGPLEPARSAYLQVSAERGGSASHQVAYDRLLGRDQGVAVAVGIEMPTENVGDVEPGPLTGRARRMSGMH